MFEKKEFLYQNTKNPFTNEDIYIRSWSYIEDHNLFVQVSNLENNDNNKIEISKLYFDFIRDKVKDEYRKKFDEYTESECIWLASQLRVISKDYISSFNYRCGNESCSYRNVLSTLNIDYTKDLKTEGNKTAFNYIDEENNINIIFREHSFLDFYKNNVFLKDIQNDVIKSAILSIKVFNDITINDLSDEEKQEFYIYILSLKYSIVKNLVESFQENIQLTKCYCEKKVTCPNCKNETDYVLDKIDFFS